MYGILSTGLDLDDDIDEFLLLLHVTAAPQSWSRPFPYGTEVRSEYR